MVTPSRPVARLGDTAPARVLQQYVWREPATTPPYPSAVARVRRGQVTVAVVGVALWLGGLIPGIIEWPGVVYGCLAVVTVVCLGTVIRPPRETTLLTATLVVTAVAVLWTTKAQEAGSPLAAAWFDAAAVSTVGSATLRRALVWLAAVGAVSVTSWSLLAVTTGIAGGWHSVIAWTLASLGIGLTAAGMAAVVRAGGRRLDGTVASAEQVITDEEILAVEAAEHAATTRLLHDTVINTLTAIGRGVPASDLGALRLRCQQDLDLIDRSLPGDPLEDPLAAVRSRAAALGLQLTVSGSPDSLQLVSPDVMTALGGAINEALLNVAKHASTGDVAITLDAEESPGQLLVQVVDSGSGWTGTPPVGGGISESILARCRDVGISARVRSQPGDGTTVTLGVPLSDGVASEAVFIDESRIMTAMVCAVLLVDFGIRTLLTMGVAPAMGSAVAFCLLALTMTWPWWRSSTWHDPGPLAPLGLALVGLPIVLLLPVQQGAVSWVWWGSAAAVAVFLALVAMNASAWWLVLAFVLQMAGRWVAGDESLALVVPDAVVVGLGAVVALWIRARVLALMAETTEVARDRDAARAALVMESANQRESLRRLKRATLVGRRPLDAIAAGERTGAESDIRAEAVALAPYLRNIARVGPELGDLGRSLVGLLDVGLERRAAVTLSIDPKARPPAVSVERALVQLIDGVVGELQPKQAVTVTLINRGATTLITVLGAADSLDPAALARLRGEGVAVSHAPGHQEDWVEIAWRASDGSTSP